MSQRVFALRLHSFWIILPRYPRYRHRNGFKSDFESPDGLKRQHWLAPAYVYEIFFTSVGNLLTELLFRKISE